MKYKLVIFDFDGTLADTFPWILSILDAVADKYKVKKVERSELETFRTYDAGKLMKLHHVYHRIIHHGYHRFIHHDHQQD